MRNLFTLLLASVLLLGCATTDVTPTQDPVTIETPYGAELFCIENPKSELCEGG